MDKNVESFLGELLRSGNPLISPPYSGIATFLRAPSQKGLSDLDIALIGIPFDGGVTNRAGARPGPREIRNRGFFAFQNHQSKIIPLQLCRVADIGDVPIPDRYSLDAGIGAIEAFYKRVAEAGVVPISAGGEAALRAGQAGTARLLGDYDLVVLDEAHTVEQVASDHFGQSVSSSTVRFLLRELYNERTDRGVLALIGDAGAIAAQVMIPVNM